jgi:hypothetical protein
MAEKVGYRTYATVEKRPALGGNCVHVGIVAGHASALDSALLVAV